MKSQNDSLKEDLKRTQVNNESIISNLRMQLDETKQMITSLRDAKEREFNKLR